MQRFKCWSCNWGNNGLLPGVLLNTCLFPIWVVQIHFSFREMWSVSPKREKRGINTKSLVSLRCSQPTRQMVTGLQTLTVWKRPELAPHYQTLEQIISITDICWLVLVLFPFLARFVPFPQPLHSLQGWFSQARRGGQQCSRISKTQSRRALELTDSKQRH